MQSKGQLAHHTDTQPFQGTVPTFQALHNRLGETRPFR
jgi:hypothetical protein